MRRLVVIVPDLVGNPADDSPLRQNMPALSALTELGTLTKIAPMPEVETPEALYLGMGPREAQMAQGPLTVSALGADPPERSTQFHLSLMSYDGNIARKPEYLPTPADLNLLWPHAARLNTSTLTLLKGEGLDHALVWEKVAELHTTPADFLYGNATTGHLPEGDGEKLLRRLIDDSVNLLSELEFNRRRIDEGLPPFNLLWPWGQGSRPKVPNLMLRRGERGYVESASMRLAGLTRLTGYLHGDRAAFGNGLNTRFRTIAERVKNRDVEIVLIEAAQLLRAPGREEELHWLVREFDAQFLGPLKDSLAERPARLTLLAPSPGTVGLGLTVDVTVHAPNPYPFDERSLEERSLPTVDLSRLVELGVTL